MCMTVGNQKVQISWMKYCNNRLVEMIKEHDCRGNKTSLEQRRCCSRCCSNLVAIADKISRVLTDKATTDVKKLRSKVSKNKRHETTCVWLP